MIGMRSLSDFFGSMRGIHMRHQFFIFFQANLSQAANPRDNLFIKLLVRKLKRIYEISRIFYKNNYQNIYDVLKK